MPSGYHARWNPPALLGGLCFRRIAKFESITRAGAGGSRLDGSGVHKLSEHGGILMEDKADRGVGCGPRGPPHEACEIYCLTVAESRRNASTLLLSIRVAPVSTKVGIGEKGSFAQFASSGVILW
jgi:hypothetical protein